VVVGHQADAVRAAVVDACGSRSVEFAVQAQPLGTGHAVASAMPAVPAHAEVALVLSGDVPLLRPATIQMLCEECRGSAAGLAFATFRPADAFGYGRVVRDAAGHATSIVEQRDAAPDQLAIDECNAGIYAIEVARLREDLPRLGQHNAQGELYLTDLVALAAARGPVATVEIAAGEAAGVNTPEQLAELQARA
jgi:bifunctional UDP-N-acetylglucosamine pyrophosphorylase/glucosamine-1-phosphate N-acetyltransferase